MLSLLKKNSLTETILLSSHNIGFEGHVMIWGCEQLLLSGAQQHDPKLSRQSTRPIDKGYIRLIVVMKGINVSYLWRLLYLVLFKSTTGCHSL